MLFNKIHLRYLLISFYLLSINIFAQEDYKQYMSLPYAEIDSMTLNSNNNGTYKQSIILLKAAYVKAQNDINVSIYFVITVICLSQGN